MNENATEKQIEFINTLIEQNRAAANANTPMFDAERNYAAAQFWAAVETNMTDLSKSDASIIIDWLKNRTTKISGETVTAFVGRHASAIANLISHSRTLAIASSILRFIGDDVERFADTLTTDDPIKTSDLTAFYGRDVVRSEADENEFTFASDPEPAAIVTETPATETTDTTVYFNVSDGYGDFYEVNIDDYNEMEQMFLDQMLNESDEANVPGEFEHSHRYGQDVIVNRRNNEVVAWGYSGSADDSQFERNELGVLSDRQIIEVKRALGQTCTVEQAADACNVSEQSIYNILQDDTRRAEIFPRARKVGVGKRGTWVMNPDDVLNWTPRNYPRS
jgi:hypothetical protein